MSTGIGDILNFEQLPIDSPSRELTNQFSIDAVDKLADELVAEYSNPNFRRWYCKTIYQFGFEQILEWRRRASDGSCPAKLFSKYVKDASTFMGSRSDSDG